MAAEVEIIWNEGAIELLVKSDDVAAMMDMLAGRVPVSPIPQPVYPARGYSLMRSPRTARRWIRLVVAQLLERVQKWCRISTAQPEKSQFTACAHVLAAGVDIMVVQEQLSHSSRALTSDTYTSVLPEVARAAAEAAAALMARGAIQAQEHAWSPQHGDLQAWWADTRQIGDDDEAKRARS